MEKLQIQNMRDVRSFIYYLIVECELGAGYHPDTPICDYVEVGAGKPTFTDPQQIANLQHGLERCHEVCDALGQDIYEQGVNPLAYLGLLECQQMERQSAPDPETKELADGTEVEVLSPDQAMLLNRYGKLVYWVDDDGHESLIHREAEITEMATRGAWFYAE